MGKNSRNFRQKLHADVALDDHESSSFDSLPADLVCVILSFLSGKEAASMATLSKTCKEQCPVLNFDECKYRTSNLSKEEQSVIFNKLVDESLSKLKNWDYSHKTLRFHTDNAFILKRMNHWLALARINKITDLYLDFRAVLYPLPRSIFASKSITVLNLRGCTLPRRILNEKTRLDTLKELHLTLVTSAGRLIDHLRHICPSIVNLSLIYCTKINNLTLSCLDKLTQVNVKDLSQINSIVIEAESLRIFKFHGRRGKNDIFRRLCNNGNIYINVSRCKNLEVLYLDSSAQIKGLSYDICSEFPLLKELLLGICGSSLSFKIASPVLQKLLLSNKELVVDPAIDTPNLQYFKCTNLSWFRAMISNPKEIDISLHHYQVVDICWFSRLRTLIEEKHSERMKLSIELVYAMVKFEHEDCFSWVSPGISVLNLKIGTIMNENHIVLIDGLLWSCHPKTLSVQFRDSHIKQESIQAFCHELCNTETKPNCCRATRKKCWRYYIKHVDMEQSGDRCRDTLERHQKLNFNMIWGKVNYKKK